MHAFVAPKLSGGKNKLLILWASFRKRPLVSCNQNQRFIAVLAHAVHRINEEGWPWRLLSYTK